MDLMKYKSSVKYIKGGLNMRMQDAIIKRITELCAENEITFYQLSIISAVPPSTLKNILNGCTKNPGIITLQKICDGLDISVQNFFASDIFNSIEQEIL